MPHSQHYEVIVNPAAGRKRSIDVFPPIPSERASGIRRRLGKYITILTDHSPLATVMHPVHITDEVYGPGSRILVLHHTKDATFSWMERYIDNALNPAEPETAPDLSEWEAAGEQIFENITVDPKYL